MNPILTRFKRRPLEIYDRKICLESNDLPNPAMCPFHLLDILGDVSKESQKSVSWRSYNLISILWIWDLIKIQKEYKILQIIMKLILYWKVSKGWTICQGLTGRRSELSFHNAFMVSSSLQKIAFTKS